MHPRHAFCQTVGKFEDSPLTNEDSATANEDLGYLAVSDGAGGGGVYADRWSKYLVDNLPPKPICTFEELDGWIGDIWEPFYNDCEAQAKRIGGLLLDKFYDEGSFATLVAVWRTSQKESAWISYGDSVAFCYNPTTKELRHSFTSLRDFSKPPYLINCKDELRREGFRSGVFEVDNGCVVFCASDALSHYVLSMYEVSRPSLYDCELLGDIGTHSKNSNFTKAVQSLGRVDFEKDVILKLKNIVKNRHNFSLHMQALERRGILAHDDYSLSLMVVK